MPEGIDEEKFLHDEDYDEPFNKQNLNHRTMVHDRFRPIASLDGMWSFTLDRYDSGLRQGWYANCHILPEQRTEPWDYDLHNGETIRIPSNWNFDRPQYFHYEGSAWYGKQIGLRDLFTDAELSALCCSDATLPDGKKAESPTDLCAWLKTRRILLRIGAANYDTKVFVNGEFVGNHYGGSTPFYVDITEHGTQNLFAALDSVSSQESPLSILELLTATPAVDHTDLLLLCVNNDRQLDRVPMRHCDWFQYGGIYRETGLLRLNSSGFIRTFRVALVPDETLRTVEIMVEVEVDEALADAAMVEVRVTWNGDCTQSMILEHDSLSVTGTKPLVSNGSTNILKFCATLPRAPDVAALWSPEDPVLHLFEAKLCLNTSNGRHIATLLDSVIDHIGLREIRRSGRRLLLNGRPLRLRGICAHEDDADLGKVTSEQDIRQRLRHAKDLHCNFMRLAHYPHHEMATQLADEIGLLLWTEIAVYWAIDFDSEKTYADAENQLLEMIRRDWNRASVVCWGVGNENEDTDRRLVFMRRLVDAARAEDPWRLVGAACLLNREARRMADRLAESLDVVGINEYYGWYYPDALLNMREIALNYRLERPLVITETGAGAVAGHHDLDWKKKGIIDHERDEDGDPMPRIFTEEHQVTVYRQQFRAVKEMGDKLQGFCPWLLYDFRTERRKNALQKDFNRKGLIDRDKRTKKQAYYALQKFYAPKDSGGDGWGHCGSY
eukprot:Clim_evm7s170 gene=Clim_evmTU7s170